MYDLRSVKKGRVITSRRLNAMLGAAMIMLAPNGAALAQQAINTSELTVTGGNARVTNSNNAPAPIGPQGSPTPRGVYVAGNPVLGYCASDGDPCDSWTIANMKRGQLVLSGETIDPNASEHAFFQHFIVNNGGQNPAVGKEGFDTYTVLNPTPGMPTTAPNAPATWAINGNLIMQPGTRPRFAVGFEQDLTNNSGAHCSEGPSGDCHLAFLLAQGDKRITSVITMGGDGQALFGIDVGDRGRKHDPEGLTPFATRADIRIRDSAPVGLLFQNDFRPVSHSIASIQDLSVNTPTTLQTEGTRTIAALNLLDTAPVGLRIAGNHQVGISLAEDSNAATAINMRPGQAVCWNTAACMIWTAGDGFFFTNAQGDRVARLDNGGQLFLRGEVRQNAAGNGL